MRIYWRDSRPMVDWGYLGTRRFTDPFFTQTINPCVAHPADLLFRHQTPLENLGEIASQHPGVRPTGFIFHMSRCGSTLMSQMLAALPENIVLSEAGPIDDILRAHFRNRGVTDEQRVQWLRWTISVLAWRRHPAERNLFIKFDCWHVMFLPLIRRAFPGVPWIFLYREPLEVMASAQKHLGGQMIPGVLEPNLFGWDLPAVAGMTLYEYAARVLAKLCESALAGARAGDGKLVNYRELPTSIWPALTKHWKVEFSPEQMVRMLDAARLDAKNPVLPFEADSQAKRDSATPETRALTERWLAEVYQRLESERQAQGGV
ncbi:MAG TPA: sulfotransferase [Verrucomicrobiae bacterium]|nr:sulfotransferase [Verrucomicrobiae bacterium]